MEKIIVILVPVLTVVAAVLLFVFVSGSSSVTENSQPTGKLMSIESYVSQNISTLSPITATMGGTFYVTGVKAEGGYGTVNYEDGHNAYMADFTFTATDRDGIMVTSFVIVRK